MVEAKDPIVKCSSMLGGRKYVTVDVEIPRPPRCGASISTYPNHGGTRWYSRGASSPTWSGLQGNHGGTVIQFLAQLRRRDVVRIETISESTTQPGPTSQLA